MQDYIKHLVKCKCILPQLKYKNPPIFHSFVAFSVIEEDGSVKPSFAQCNNCGVIHKVTEIGTSTVIKKEEMPSLITIDEIKISLPENLTKLISQYDCPLPTWQEVQFILENQLWGKAVILTKEKTEGIVSGKYLLIAGENLFQIKSFSKEEDTYV